MDVVNETALGRRSYQGARKESDPTASLSRVAEEFASSWHVSARLHGLAHDLAGSQEDEEKRNSLYDMVEGIVAKQSGVEVDRRLLNPGRNEREDNPGRTGRQEGLALPEIGDHERREQEGRSREIWTIATAKVRLTSRATAT